MAEVSLYWICKKSLVCFCSELSSLQEYRCLLLAMACPLAWLAATAAVASGNDSLALTAFMTHMSTSGGSPPVALEPTWGNRSIPVCRWRGVTCGARGQRRGRVVALELPGLGLRGTMPPQLGNLTYLRRLHLAGNRLHGVLPPELGSLTDLIHLNLSDNSLQGQIPASLANCTRLEILALYNNRFHGDMPPELCSLRGLKVLSLGMNTLTGSIPSEIGNLVNLMTLNLQFSNLTGGIPKEIGGLASLVALGLGYNQLAGSIPASLGNLSALQYLSVPAAKLTGRIPSLQNLSSLLVIELGDNNLEGTVPAWLGNLSSLVFLSLQQNRLSGYIPESLGPIPDSLGNLGALRSLRLDYNKLEGTFPSSLLNLSSLDDLGLQSNRLSGTIPPDIGNKLPNLQSFVVDINQFHGTIPPSLCNASMLQVLQTVYNSLSGRIPQCLGSQQKRLSVVALSKNQLKATNDADWAFLSSLANCSNLKALDLGYNRLQGELPSSIGNLSSHLSYLIIANNNISGTIPEGIGNLINLKLLYMDFNRLEGIIPASLGKLKMLNKLSIPYNNLSGSIPPTIGNLTALNLLQLQGNALDGGIPSSINNCPLELLDLSYNNLNGLIPKQLFLISTLSSSMVLAHNSLSGPLPTEIGNLQNLGVLDFSSNNISGELPTSLGECKSLQQLNISGNFLQGIIPSSLAQLKGLLVLDLSDNNLSGAIPEFLGSIRGLSILNLSFNKFEGEVPKDGVFLNATATSITGNDGLCGGIPELKLPPCFNQTAKKASRKLAIIISICTTVPLIILVFMLLAFYYRSKMTKPNQQIAIISEQYMRVSYAELVNATDGFASDNLIGTGSFGSVYKGRITSNDQEVFVAVKVLNLMQRGASQSFMAECETLRSARHRNLVKILTACSSIDFQGNEFKALVYEYLPNGNLDQWLHPNTTEHRENKALHLIERLCIAIDVASSLEYLHQYKPSPIVHCDLKPSNVLLDSDMVARVSDFGLARFLHQESDKSSGWASMRGTIGYAAPEYGIGNEVSIQGDVYSYGILLLEMFTGKRPTDSEFGEAVGLRKYVQMALPDKAANVMDQQLLPEMEIENDEPIKSNSYNSKDLIIACVASIMRIGISCSEEAPTDRVQIRTALKELQAIRDKFEKHLSCEGTSISAILDCLPSFLLAVVLLVSPRPAVAIAGDVSGSGSDRAALMAFKKLVSGSLASWRDDAPACRWRGVACGASGRRRGRVVALDLAGVGITGEVATALGNITYLRRLNLPENRLHGELPWQLGRLGELRHLNLSNNGISGELPSELCSLRRLEVLDLGNNRLTGRIPREIGNLVSLKHLVLESNNLTGEIPSQIGNLVNLVRLSIGSNQLSGSIPASIGNLSQLIAISAFSNNLTGRIPPLEGLSSLSYLNLGSNKLGGTIPSWLGNLSSLIALDLQSNGFAGCIPESLGDLQFLEAISLADNKLRCRIPDSFGNLHALTEIYLDNNELEGPLPLSMFNLSSLEMLNIQDNNLTGVFPPDLGDKLPNLQQFHVSENQFHGLIPPSLCNLSMIKMIQTVDNFLSGTIPQCLGRNQNMLSVVNFVGNQLEAVNDADWGFLTSLTNCSNMILIDVSINKLQGVLPKAIGNMSTQLEYFGIANNNITGTIPESVGNLVNLEELDMENNLLKGTIPSSLGNLKKLNRLSLSNNIFSGSIPVTLGNLNKLTILLLSTNVLSGAIPSTLSNCPLEMLDLSYNNLSGPIPKEVFLISKISSFMYLAHNKLTGNIPSDVGTLKNLGELDLSDNMISGKIPTNIGECQSLQYLNLSGNFLEGTIAPSLEQLRGLLVLDLSHNNLSGTIPEFLGSMTGLSTLNLSSNDFQGEVPKYGIFLNATATSVIGNIDLCGGAPQLKLPICSNQTKHGLSSKVVMVIIIGSTILFLILFTCFAIHQRTKLSRAHSKISLSDEQHMRVSYAQLSQATNSFASENLIGVGSFGSVYKGRIGISDQQMVVAVKVLNLQQAGAYRSFDAECEALRCIRHRNLVKILTVCSGIDFQGSDFKALVFEFLPNGNLDQWLHKHLEGEGEPKVLNLDERLQIAIDVASALEYLHQHKPCPIVHCDLKPSNILLDNDKVAHVGDFGLARFLHQEHINSSEISTGWNAIRGTIGYVAPEYGLGNEVSIQGDVYSYGILLLEMFTGKRPTNSEFGEILTLHEYVEKALPGQTTSIIDQSLLDATWNSEGTAQKYYNIGEVTIKCIVSILKVGILCSKEMPTDRMQIGDALRELQAIRDKFDTHQLW
uniref:Receptor kinase-like protein Xa21 n=1 Tax=Leersia perrieri TaxID=77586 RepID=A0A0D9VDR1_9ORYZ